MKQTNWLHWIERVGNRLPEPAMLFAWAAALVMVLSQLVSWAEWSVMKPANAGEPVPVQAVGLLTSDGIWWLLSHMVKNFINFPPLGIVLVGMLGLGVAERSGLINALIRRVMAKLQSAWLTPVTIFLGIMSSLTLDAGYIVLPPLAAALYQGMGRPPLAGLAAAFAGVSAGFSANLLITAIDPLLAGLTQAGAQVLQKDYQVAVTANWWFMIVSTIVLTAAGWWVTARFVEPYQHTVEVIDAGNTADINDTETVRGLKASVVAMTVILLLILLLILVPGAPLYGSGERFDRWVETMVPLLFIFFLVPSVVYGYRAGTIKNHRDVARMMGDTMASLGPYIVLAFFAAQFIALFNHSRLGEMLAIAGGQMLAAASLPPALLMISFVLVVWVGNLFIGSASAKYAFFAPVFVPMFMLAGISPELTQAAYRVGDSVSNVITPLNPYFVIVLAFMRKYAPQAGIGTMASLMIPYAILFTLVWGVLLALWILAGADLGPGGRLYYP